MTETPDAHAGPSTPASIPGTSETEQAPFPASEPSPQPVFAGDALYQGVTRQRPGSIAVLDPAGGEIPSASLDPGERVVPTWTDPTVRRASDVIGGPLGLHGQVGRNVVFTPLRVCIAMAILVLISGWLYKSACIQQAPDGSGVEQLDQSGQRPWITGCYNDVVPLYGSHQLSTQALPYKTSWVDSGDGQVQYMEYPVVTGYWMWGVSEISNTYRVFAAKVGLPVPLDVAAYFTIGAILLGLMYLVAVNFTARIARRRVWDTAIMCLSPLLVVHAFTNWDLLAIGLTAAAMFCWSKSRWDPLRPGYTTKWLVLTGVMIALGTSAKLYPVLLLGPLLVLAIRTGRWRGWLVTAGAAVGAWLIINVPVMIAFPAGWYEFIKLNGQRPAEYDSWYSIFSTLSGSTVFDIKAGSSSPTLLNALSLVLFALACVALTWFTLSVRRRPRFAQLAFLLVAVFLLTNKVWSPQYSLWLLPLVVLALPRWRPVLAWQFSEVVVWILLMLSFDTDPGKNLSIYPFIGAALIRDALLIMLMVKVIREIIRPAGDLVRMAGDDDPSGGVFADAPDHRIVPSLPILWAANRSRRSAELGELVPSASTESVPQ